MSENPQTPFSELCPTCGTRVRPDAARCPVCGSELKKKREKDRPAKAVRGSRMPEITLSLPVAMILLVLVLVAGGVGVYFGIKSTVGIVQPTPEATATNTPTPSLTPTPLTPTVTLTPLPSVTPFTHIVRQDDSCGLIAALYNSSVQAIIQENTLDANCSLFIDMELKVPQPTPTKTPLASPTPNATEMAIASCETENYIVKADETLSLIASVKEVPAEAIREWNGLPTDNVYEGQQLTIPYCERQVVGGATVTPSPAPPYPAPELLLPLDGASFTLAEDTVSLQWSSVGTLRENEAYQVTIVDITAGDDRSLVAQVIDTKYIIPQTFRPTDNVPHVFRWSVAPVVRRGVEADTGNPSWELAGTGSVTWVFTWSGTTPAQAGE
jgi:LysM repeat protein